MYNFPVLVVSRDADVVETVREAVAVVSGCRCYAVAEIDQALEFLADSPSALCIYHATDSNREALDWLLEDLTATRRFMKFPNGCTRECHPGPSAGEFAASARAGRAPPAAMRLDWKSTRLNSSHLKLSRMPSSA